MKNKVPLLFAGIAVVVNSCNVGVQIGKALERSEIDAEDRLEQIQTHNRQLEDQLIPSYQGLGRLSLNDENNTFEFHIDSSDLPDQTCSGEYKVVNNNAQAVGEIACTKKLPVGN